MSSLDRVEPNSSRATLVLEARLGLDSKNRVFKTIDSARTRIEISSRVEPKTRLVRTLFSDSEQFRRGGQSEEEQDPDIVLIDSDDEKIEVKEIVRHPVGMGLRQIQSNVSYAHVEIPGKSAQAEGLV